MDCERIASDTSCQLDPFARSFRAISALGAALFLSACSPGGGSPYFDTVTVFAARSVTNGLPDFGLQSVLLRGNFGVIDVEGMPYSVTTNGIIAYNAEGPSTPPGAKSRSASGWLTFFVTDEQWGITNTTLRSIRDECTSRFAGSGQIHALRITGRCPIIESEERGRETDVEGQFISLVYPAYLAPLSNSPDRYWFVDTRRRILLTVRDADIAEGVLEIDGCNDLQVRLPPATFETTTP